MWKSCFFLCILITRSPICIPFLPTTLFRCVGGVHHVSWLSDLRFTFWSPKPQNICFWKPTRWKNVYFCESWQRGVRFPFHLFLQPFLDVWELWVKFHGYQIDGLHFDPPNPKILVIDSLRVEKVGLLRILIIGSSILIPFVPTTFFRCVRGLS